MFIHVYTQTHAKIHMHGHVQAHTRAGMHAGTHARMHTYTHTHTHTHTHTYTHTHTHTHTHVYTRTLTHTHVHVSCFLSPALFPSGDQCCDAVACPCSEVPQTPEHLCPAKLQTRCDICCACQSFCLFIATDSSMPRAVDPQKSLQPKTVHECVPIGTAHSRFHLLQEVH